jgi:hypothetical protein
MKQNQICPCVLLAVILLAALVFFKSNGRNEQPKKEPTREQLVVIPPTHSLSYQRRIMSGIPKEYTPVGYLQQPGADSIYPLYGRSSRTNVNRWNYHTVTDRLSNIPLPIQSLDGRDCTMDMGCNELYDGDVVQIKGVTGVFTVTMYPMDFRRDGL